MSGTRFFLPNSKNRKIFLKPIDKRYISTKNYKRHDLRNRLRFFTKGVSESVARESLIDSSGWRVLSILLVSFIAKLEEEGQRGSASKRGEEDVCERQTVRWRLSYQRRKKKKLSSGKT